jgi:hypothetical protein
MPIWSNPENINLSSPFIYHIRLVDSVGFEWRYIGKASTETRLKEYERNISKIVQGLPRRSLPSYRTPTPQDLNNQRYRAVHFGLAKALELGWKYDFKPIHTVSQESLNEQERHFQSVFKCNLNDGKTWVIEHYRELAIRDLIPNPPY